MDNFLRYVIKSIKQELYSKQEKMATGNMMGFYGGQAAWKWPWVRCTNVGKAKRAPAKMQVLFLVTVDNNDTVLYGCIMVALELQP
ncbi:MAG: hypothetical protein IJO37_07785 [Ruminiclostridium sp.]|nr:hypothetical protein [Ruminiclostridium sp.]